MTWFFFVNRKERQQQREEAQAALRETRDAARKIGKKEADSRGLFARIHQLHEENHISEAVRHLMEGS